MSGVAALAATAGLVVPAAAGSAAAAPAVPALRAAVRPPGAPFRTGMAPFGTASAPFRMAAGAVALIFQGGEISCGTAKTCLSVGTSINASTGNAIPSVRAWHGSAWRSVSVHAPKGTTFQTMAGVSCKTASYCLMIGSDTSGASGVSRPFALAWTGKAISAVRVPPVPSGAAETNIADVTCLAVRNCVATGTAFWNSGATRVVVETWNGSKWTLRTAAAPAGLTITAASCVSPSSCVLGGDSISASGVFRVFLGRWNGKAVTAMKVPVPAGFKTPFLFSVSCATASDCAATGANIAGSATPQLTGFAETWNGKAWTAAKLAPPKGRTLSVAMGVSCTYSKTAGRHCVAVGVTGTQKSGGAAAYSFNGKTWSAQRVPAPAAGKSDALEGVSCLSPRYCVATGETGPSNGNTSTPIAGFWNGSAWKVTAA